MLKRTDLHSYQVDAIERMKWNSQACVWAGLGDGKTAIALTVIADLGVEALVFGTKKIIEYAWPAELEKWEHLDGLSYAACIGSLRDRENAILSRPRVLGVSYENLKWFYDQTGSYETRPLVVFDEISKMKDQSTQRFKAFKKHREQYGRLYGLTATPATESYLGLYAQYRTIVTEPILGRTLTQFRETYTTPVFKGMFTDYKVGPLQKRAIEAAIAPYTIVVDGARKRSEPTLIDVPISWTSKNDLLLYKQMEKKLILELEGQRTPIQAASKGVAFNKCRQLATGFIYDGDEVFRTDPAKMDAIVEEYEALGGEPALILYQFLWERDELLERLDGAEPLEGDAYERFNRGEIKALVVHPNSCGHGLNLQGECRHIFWSSLPWSLEGYLQSNGRIDRQGQKKQVVIKRFLRQNSIDGDIVARLAGKVESMTELIERMRGRV